MTTIYLDSSYTIFMNIRQVVKHLAQRILLGACAAGRGRAPGFSPSILELLDSPAETRSRPNAFHLDAL